ncbi:periplasmic protein TonB [Azospirillaceae bacterium]
MKSRRNRMNETITQKRCGLRVASSITEKFSYRSNSVTNCSGRLLSSKIGREDAFYSKRRGASERNLLHFFLLLLLSITLHAIIVIGISAVKFTQDGAIPSDSSISIEIVDIEALNVENTTKSDSQNNETLPNRIDLTDSAPQSNQDSALKQKEEPSTNSRVEPNTESSVDTPQPTVSVLPSPPVPEPPPIAPQSVNNSPPSPMEEPPPSPKPPSKKRSPSGSRPKRTPNKPPSRPVENPVPSSPPSSHVSVREADDTAVNSINTSLPTARSESSPDATRQVSTASNRYKSQEEEAILYGKIVWARVVSHRPSNVKLRGTTIIKISLSHEGQLTDVSVSKSSSIDFLDQIALEAVHTAAPFPRPPESMTESQLTYIIPFHFR